MVGPGLKHINVFLHRRVEGLLRDAHMHLGLLLLVLVVRREAWSEALRARAGGGE